MEQKPKENLNHENKIQNIVENISTLYSSISEGFIQVTKYLSQYQLLLEKEKKNKNKSNNMINLTENGENNENSNNNKLSQTEDKNNLIIVLNNSPNSNKNINEKEKNIKEEIIDEKKEQDNERELKNSSINENKSVNDKDNKNWEINTILKKINMNFKNNPKKINKSEMKLPINNINNYYFKEINITNNNNIKNSCSELKKKREENKSKSKKVINDKNEKKEYNVNKINKNENNKIIDLDEDEKKLQNKDLLSEKNKDKKINKGYKFKIKFLDYCYVFGFYQSYNDAYYDKVQISKYFNDIDLFSLNFNEQYSYKNISIKLKEKYPLLSVKYLKNKINYESKIKIK